MTRTIPVLISLFISLAAFSQSPLDDIIKKERSGFRLEEAKILSVSSSNFDVKYYRCHWELDPAVRFISGSVTSHFTMLGNSSSIIYDLTSALTVDSVVYHGSKIAFNRSVVDG